MPCTRTRRSFSAAGSFSAVNNILLSTTSPSCCSCSVPDMLVFLFPPSLACIGVGEVALAARLCLETSPRCHPQREAYNFLISFRWTYTTIKHFLGRWETRECDSMSHCSRALPPDENCVETSHFTRRSRASCIHPKLQRIRAQNSRHSFSGLFTRYRS